MSIAARCDDCQKLYKVDDKLAGKRVRCKACGGVVSISAQAAAPRGGESRASASPGASEASRKARSEPPAAPGVEEDDPFGGIDALLSLEAGGTVSDNSAPVHRSSAKRRNVVE